MAGKWHSFIDGIHFQHACLHALNYNMLILMHNSGSGSSDDLSATEPLKMKHVYLFVSDTEFHYACIHTLNYNRTMLQGKYKHFLFPPTRGNYLR